LNRKNRKVISLIISIFMTFSIFAGNMIQAKAEDMTQNQSPQLYPDIDKHWAEQYITNFSQKCLISGYPDGTFRPDSPITTAEFVTLINKTFGFKQIVSISFSDVAPSDWFAQEISKAKAQGYITGYEDGTFRHRTEISRQEAAVILCKVLKLHLSEKTEVLTKFKDADKIPEWSKLSLSTAVEAGYISGYPDGTIRPLGSISRAETVTILSRAVAALYKDPGVYGSEEEITEITGNVIISSDGVTLKNTIIHGNLYLSSGIGEGDVTLDTVTVNGRTIVSGGGKDSIHFKNFRCEEVIVIKTKGEIRIVAADDTSIQKLLFESAGYIEGEGEGIEEIYLLKPGQNILFDGNFDKVIVQAKVDIEVTGDTVIEYMELTEQSKDSEITINKGGIIKNLLIDAPASIRGEGKIQEAEVNVNGVSFEKKPDKLTLAEGVEVEIEEKEEKPRRKDDKPVKPEQAQFVRPDYLSYKDKLYVAYELQDKYGKQIPFYENTIESISVVIPDGTTISVTVEDNEIPYLYFCVANMPGTYTFTVVTKGEDAKSYLATLDWPEPVQAEVSFKAPAGAEAVFTPATEDAPAQVDFSKVTADKLLDWTSVKDGYYAIELKIEGVNLSEDNVKFAYRVYQDGTDVMPEVKGDLDCQYVTTDWKTGLARMYYVLADGSLYQAKINVMSLTPRAEEPTAKPISNILEVIIEAN
jgi:hypothetical protein